MSLRSRIERAVIASSVKAVMAIGTSSMGSARLRAVTSMSSSKVCHSWTRTWRSGGSVFGSKKTATSPLAGSSTDWLTVTEPEVKISS